MPFRVIDFRPLRKISLLGFGKVELPSGMIVADVTVLRAVLNGRGGVLPPFGRSLALGREERS